MPASSEQEALVGCLARKSAKLAKIYKGALVVLFDETNPSRFELAAHSVRELIEKSSLLTSGEEWTRGDGMKSRLTKVRGAYNALIQGSGFNEQSSLSASEDQLRTVVRELSRYIEWEDTFRPKRRQRIAKLLSDLSGPGQALPVDAIENEVGRWMDAHEYFDMVAHNRYDHVDRDHFAGHMTFVERVLLSRLQPPAVPELDALDALIKEGENGH